MRILETGRPGRSLVAGLYLLASLLAGGALAQTTTGNLIANRLEGSWSADPTLTPQLTGMSVEPELTVAFRREPTAVAGLGEHGAALANREIFFTGSMSMLGRDHPFVLTSEQGIPTILSVWPNRGGAPGTRLRRFTVMLAVAKEPSGDLLFLGTEDASEPMTPFRRSPDPARLALSPETAKLLDAALMVGDTRAVEEAMARLPDRPDWQAVIDVLVADMRRAPDASHNNRSLLLEAIVSRHLPEARLDVAPLIAAIRTRSWTNQQKTAQVLAAAAERPELFRWHEQPAIAALIPLTASQRSRVVQAALATLHRLTDQRLGRQPSEWVAWYEAKYGEKLDLTGSVYELVTTVRRVEEREAFKVGETLVEGLGGLQAEARRFAERARALGLEPAVVLLGGDEQLASGADSTIRWAEPLIKALGEVGITSIVVSPRTDEFYPPFEPGFPRTKPASPGSVPRR